MFTHFAAHATVSIDNGAGQKCRQVEVCLCDSRDDCNAKRNKGTVSASFNIDGDKCWLK